MPRPPHPAPPDAYLSPDGRHWWDGREWVPNASAPVEPAIEDEDGEVPDPAAVAADAHRRARAMQTAAGLVLAGGALASLGAFLPWASATAGGLTVSIAGTSGGHDGWISFAAGIVAMGAGVWFLAGRLVGAAGVVAVLSGLTIAGIGIYDLADLKGRLGALGGNPLFSTGADIGLYATVAGGVLVLAGPWLASRATE